MDNKINPGDIVDIHYCDGGRIVRNALVNHVPCDVGDMWHFIVEGRIVYQNPSSSNLEAVVKNPNSQKENL